MSTVTRLEAPVTLTTGLVPLVILYPHGGSVYQYQPSGTFPHHQALMADFNAWAVTESLPLTMSEAYATRAITIASSASAFDAYFIENYGNGSLRDWLGILASDNENKTSITGRACDSICHLDCPPMDDAFALRLNRAANFSDAGRVAGVLLNRYMLYSCTLSIDNDEHTDFRAFWAWIAESRKLTMWRRFNTAWTPAQAHTSTPLLGDSLRMLSLTDRTSDDLDAPREVPDVTGHLHDIEGVVYGV